MLPEIMVGHTERDGAWARDNGRSRIRIFLKDQDAKRCELSEVTITWSKIFQSRFNPALANNDTPTNAISKTCSDKYVEIVESRLETESGRILVFLDWMTCLDILSRI